MIDDSDEIRWLKDQQPHVDPPTAEASGWARTSLLLHAERSSQLVCLDSRRERDGAASAPRRSGGALKRGRRWLVAAAAAAVVTAAGIAAVAIGVPHGGSDLLGPAPASAAVLTLAHRVQAAPPLKGDATLVLHTNSLTAGPGSSNDGSFTGADLYLVHVAVPCLQLTLGEADDAEALGRVGSESRGVVRAHVGEELLVALGAGGVVGRGKEPAGDAAPAVCGSDVGAEHADVGEEAGGGGGGGERLEALQADELTLEDGDVEDAARRAPWCMTRPTWT